MNLSELYDYKNRLMYDILSSDKIVTLIDDNDELMDGKELAYKYVFPYEYVPETVDDGWTFICIDMDIHLSYNKTLYEPYIYVWVFSHRSRLRLPDGEGIRPDAICAEIADILSGSRFYGLGELELLSTKRFAPMTDYQGKFMTFHAKDFNRQHDYNKKLPDNRKVW